MSDDVRIAEVCPSCHGSGQDGDEPDPIYGGGGVFPCARCSGTGLVWDRDGDAVGAYIAAQSAELAQLKLAGMRLCERLYEAVGLKPLDVPHYDGNYIIEQVVGTIEHLKAELAARSPASEGG